MQKNLKSCPGLKDYDVYFKELRRLQNILISKTIHFIYNGIRSKRYSLISLTSIVFLCSFIIMNSCIQNGTAAALSNDNTDMYFNEAINLKNYSNFEHGIKSISIPLNYQIIDSKEEIYADLVMSNNVYHADETTGIYILSPWKSGLDNIQDFISIQKSAYNNELSIEETKNLTDEAFRELTEYDPNVSILENQFSDMIGGSPSYKVTYTSQDDTFHPPLDLKTSEYSVPVGNNLYVISFTVEADQYEHYKNSFEAIIKSVNFAESNMDSHLTYADKEKWHVDPYEYDSREKKFIELSPIKFTNETINVVILVNEETSKQSSKYVETAKEAIRDWENLLKLHSNNENGWKFNVKTEVGFLDMINYTDANTVVVELVGSSTDYDYCNEFLGITLYESESFENPFVSTVLTSCKEENRIVELSKNDVYSTVSHEFAHSLGLGHAYNIDGDLMCSIETLDTGADLETCTSYETTGKIMPSIYDIDALLYIYGNDGVGAPNKEITENNNKYDVSESHYTFLNNRTL